MALIKIEELRDRIKVTIPKSAPYSSTKDKKKEKNTNHDGDQLSLF